MADEHADATNGTGSHAIKMSNRKRIAIIGAGPCGLTAAKSCLEEDFDVVVFDRTDDIGGLWRYRDDDDSGIPSVMKSTIINTSKEMSAFSDFPPPTEFPNFMHNTYMCKYFHMYAAKFGILPHVRLNSEVLDVSPTEDYERSGNWYVTIRSVNDGQSYREAFDGVLIATGHHTFPHWPKIAGLDSFKGTVIHTHSLKKATGFEDKNVLVVGIGNSGVDAAVECSTIAKKVYLSTRRGTWLFRRVGPDGQPFDATFTKRSYHVLDSVLPFKAKCWFMERELNKAFNHEAYGLKPAHRVFNYHPTINDALPNRILSGTVIIREDVREFTETGVMFKDDEEQTNIDTVIFATGYQIKFPFLSEEYIEVVNNKVNLYKYMFPPNLTHPSLAVIALVQVVGAIFPIAEAQGRWYAQIMNGKKKLPTREAMAEDIKSKNAITSRRYVDSPRHTIQVDYLPFLDELACLIGCKPPLLKMFFTDPKLFWKCFNGPSVPYQYRLVGPHAWAGSKEAILTTRKRTMEALNTRKRPVKPTK